MFRKSFLLFCTGLLTLLAQPIVTNGFFTESAQIHGEPPAGWTLEKPTSGAWAFVNDDGVVKSMSVRYTAVADAGALIQNITLAASTDYSILLWYKNAGAIPTVAIKAENGESIASFTADKNIKGRWYPARKDFNSGRTQKCTLVITCEELAADGKAFIDCIEIVPKAEADNRKATQTDANSKDNIALHKKYDMLTRPDYRHCTDADDAIQLTDGIRTVGYFWTQKSTVGWYSQKPAIVVVDLGQEEPICGASWNTAAGTAGVFWPESILVFSSNNQKQWNLIGDLVIDGTVAKMPPSPNNYEIYDYSTRSYSASGRYVAFMVTAPKGSEIFCDEIEIYRGDESCRQNPRYKMSITSSLPEFYSNNVNYLLATKRMDYDLKAIAASIKTLPEGSIEREEGLEETRRLSEELSGMSFDKGIIKSTVLPFADYRISAEIYAANRYLLQSRGFRKPFIWKSNRWDNLTLIDNPPTSVTPLDVKSATSLSIEMMRGEVRSDTFSISNPTKNALAFEIKAKGIPSVRIHNVVVTDQNCGIPVGSALAPIDNNDGRTDRGGVGVPAGCNVQIWLSVYKPSAKAGKYHGSIVVSGGLKAKIPVTLTIHDFDFPKEHTLNVGGWQYAATFNDSNKLANYALMRDFGMNVTWGHSSILPKNPQFDADGNLSNYDSLDFARFDSWIHDWPSCKFYCVTHFGSRTEFFGEKQGTPRFKKMLVTFFKALERRMEHHTLRPDQLVYLLEDETHTAEQDRFIISWLTPLREGGVKVRQFTDPMYDDPNQGIPEMFEVNDILCPKTSQLIAGGKPFRDFYIRQREAGRELWLYSCHGPAKNLDPVTYWRAQAWHAFSIGAVGSHFWAFGNTAGTGDSWAAYNQSGTEYGPHFVSKQESPMVSKQSEAIRESVQDFEYLVMLRDAIDAKSKAGVNNAALAKAKNTLDDAVAKATDASGSSVNWRNTNRHNVLDECAVSVLRALSELK